MYYGKMLLAMDLAMSLLSKSSCFVYRIDQELECAYWLCVQYLLRDNNTTCESIFCCIISLVGLNDRV